VSYVGYSVTVKGIRKVAPVPAIKAYGGMVVQLHLFITSVFG